MVGGDPFGGPAPWTNAPNVQFVWKRTLNEVDEGVVRRPQRKVRVHPGRRSEDGPIVRSPSAVRHEQRVAWCLRMISDPGSVLRPIELGYVFEIGFRLSAQRWHGPDTNVVD